MPLVRRSLLAAFAGTVGLATLPLMSLAQAQNLPAPPEVRVRMSISGAHAPDALSAGRYRLSVDAPNRFPGMLQLMKPDRGYTQADLRSDMRRANHGGLPALKRMLTHVRFFGGAVVAPGRDGALWETLYSGRYWLTAPAMRPGGIGVTTVRVHGTPTASRFPSVSAHATGTNHGLRLEREVPRAGRLLIRNDASFTDGLILLPLQRGAAPSDFYRWLRQGTGRPPVRFRGARVTSSLSPDAGYVLRYRLHPAEYVVFSMSSLNANRINEVFQPLTVRGARRVHRSQSSWQEPGGGFRHAPLLARRLERWHASGDVGGSDQGSRLAGLRRTLQSTLLPAHL
jgi:hypothetical protein